MGSARAHAHGRGADGGEAKRGTCGQGTMKRESQAGRSRVRPAPSGSPRRRRPRTRRTRLSLRSGGGASERTRLRGRAARKLCGSRGRGRGARRLRRPPRRCRGTAPAGGGGRTCRPRAGLRRGCGRERHNSVVGAALGSRRRAARAAGRAEAQGGRSTRPGRPRTVDRQNEGLQGRLRGGGKTEEGGSAGSERGWIGRSARRSPRETTSAKRAIPGRQSWLAPRRGGGHRVCASLSVFRPGIATPNCSVAPRSAHLPAPAQPEAMMRPHTSPRYRKRASFRRCSQMNGATCCTASSWPTTLRSSDACTLSHASGQNLPL